MSIARKIGNVADVLDSAATGDFFAKGSSDGQFQNIAYSSVVGTPGSIDSAATTALIDSAYIQARQTSGGAAGLDSATTINLIDSSYVAARSGGTSGFDIFTYTATAGQTVFQDSSSDGTILNYQENGTLVYYNGLLLANEDYTETSNDVITLAEGADSGAVISIATWDVLGSETWSSVSAAIANSKYTSALITTTGTAGDNDTMTDNSSSAHTITLNGAPLQTTFSPYRHGGYSWKFPDGAAYHIPTHTDLAFGTGEFCIEFWWRPDASIANQGGLVDWRNASGDNNSSTHPAILIDNSPAVIHWTGANNNLSYATSNFSIGTWYHIAVSRDGSNNLGLFVNGTRVDVETSHTTSYVAPTTRAYFGNWYATGSTGYSNSHTLKDIRIIKGGTGGREGTSFTVPTQPLTAVSGTVFLSARLPYHADESTSSHTISMDNTPEAVAADPYNHIAYSSSNNTGSVFLDGTDDNLSVADNSDWVLGSAWTVECWVYFHSITNYDLVFGQWAYGQQNFGFGYENDIMYFFGYNSSNTFRSDVNVDFNATTHIKKWHHLAAVYDGSNTKIYLNGKASANSLAENLGVQDRSQPLTIGKTNRLGTEYWSNISVTDARIVNGTAVYTSDFTPPTSPLTAVTNTKFLLSGNEAKIIDKSQSTPGLQLVDNATSSSTQKKFAATSMYFDGTLDEITTNGANIANFGTGDFTVEAWIYPQALSGYNPVVADNQYVSSSPSNAWCLYLHGATLDPWKSGSSILDGGSLSTNTWQHIAWTRESGTMRIFIDGSLVDTATDTTSFDHGDIIIGANVGNYHYEGYIEDLRITKGLARYTAAFTPPTSSLQG